MSTDTLGRSIGPDWVRSRVAGLTFRAVAENDMALLWRVYASTRMAELDLLDWPQAQKDAFVAMQFEAQHAHYRRHYEAMDRLIVSLNDAPIGRLYLDRGPTDHAIVDIAFLPEHRRAGLGTMLLRDLLDEAAAAGKDVLIHVETTNPAKRLYERLRFVVDDDKGVYVSMRWTHLTVAQVKTA